LPERAALRLRTPARGIAGRLGGEQIRERRGEPGVLPLARRAPAALVTDALRRAVGQAGRKLALATRNGVAVQTGDLGKLLHAAMAEACRLKGGKPAALLLIKAAEKQVDLPMQQLVRMRRARAADRTAAFVEIRGSHRYLRSRAMECVHQHIPFDRPTNRPNSCLLRPRAEAPVQRTGTATLLSTALAI
jgi:hypothetical protein